MNTRIGILGTGSVGHALGNLLGQQGYSVVFGARDPEKAAATLGRDAEVMTPVDLAAECDLLIVAVPWTGASDLLKGLPNLDGKVIVDATNPLNADWSPLLLGQETSAGEELQKALPGVRVVKAFNTIFADMMTEEKIRAATAPVTAFFCGNDAEAKKSVAEILTKIGLQPRDAGAISSARYLEAIAHLNIHIAVALQGGTHAFFSYEDVQS